MEILWFVLGCIIFAAVIVSASHGAFGPKIKKSADEIRRWWSY